MECLDCGNKNPKFFAITRAEDPGGISVIKDVVCKNQLGKNVCNSTFILIEDEDNNFHLSGSEAQSAAGLATEQPNYEPNCKQCLDTGFVADVVTKQPKLCPVCQGHSRSKVENFDVGAQNDQRFGVDMTPEDYRDEAELVSGAELGDEDDEDEEDR